MDSQVNISSLGQKEQNKRTTAANSRIGPQPRVLTIDSLAMQKKVADQRGRQGTCDDLFATWRPDVFCEKIQSWPIAPGFYGMLVHRVDVNHPKLFFCKSLNNRPSPESKSPVWRQDENARKSLHKEVRNAEQAGFLRIGPKLRFIDPQNRFFLTDWIEGKKLSSNDGRSEIIPISVVNNIEKLRNSDLSLELNSGLDHWLNRVSVKVPPANDNEDFSSDQKLFDAQEIINVYLKEIPQIQVGWVHSDLKPENIFQAKEDKVLLVNWCHLARGCPMNVLAYYAVPTDIATAFIYLLEKRFRIHAPKRPFDQRRLKLEMAMADIKTTYFSLKKGKNTIKRSSMSFRERLLV